MSLSTRQLASAGALALLAGAADAAQIGSVDLAQSADDLESHRVTLNLTWKTKRAASDVLTDLLDVDGIRVVTDRHLWDRPDTLALRHDFASDGPFYPYFAAGIDRARYLSSRALNPASIPCGRLQRSVGMTAAVGASWQLTEHLNVETDIHWMDLHRETRLLQTDAGWASGDTVAMALSLVWRGK